MLVRISLCLLVSLAAASAQQVDNTYRDQERAHRRRLQALDEQRRKTLADLGILEVAPLRPPSDPGRSLDVVFIGDGFSKEEQQAYSAIITRMAANFQTPPFDAHAGRVNLYRVNLVSPRSGIAVDDNAVAPPLGGTVKKFVGGRLLACDVNKTIRYARTAVPEADYVIVVLNTHGKFLGSANTGAIVRLSTSKGHQRSIVVHEFGHNFVGLLDEYVDKKQSGARAIPPRFRAAINAGLESNVYLAKWHFWNVPEPVFRGLKRGKRFAWADDVRCYEGAATFTDAVFRAEENCHMQRGRGKAFCRVCAEAMELGLLRFFAPIESVAPLTTRLGVAPGESVDFRVTPLATPDGGKTLEFDWYLDGRRLPARGMRFDGREAVYRVKASQLKGAPQRHVTVRVSLSSPRVRMDRGRLSATFTWTLEQRAPPPAPVRRAGVVGEPVELVGDGRWTPERPGAYELRERGRVFHVNVRPKEKRRNRGPKFLFLPDQVAREGETLAFELSAVDPDGDRLRWSAKGALPPRAALDAATGKVRWELGYTQRGSYTVEFRVTDGWKTAKRTLRVEVKGAPLHRGIFHEEVPLPESYSGADRLLVGLHHPDLRVRLRCARELRDAAPRPGLVAESLRLLRDRNAQVCDLALENLQAVFAGRGQDHFDMFLDEMPRRIWQFVDRPALLEGIAGLCRTARATPDLPRARRKEIEALLADIALIEGYNKERREKPGPPPITDKKYR